MIVVFDAQCLLCNGWVQFLLRHDRRGVFRFASMQGETGRALLAQAGLQVTGLQTLLLVDGRRSSEDLRPDGLRCELAWGGPTRRSWQHTAAILRVLHALGWPWRLAWVAWLVPAPLRDAAYRWVARNRYRVLGRADTCLLPPPGHAARFLD